MLFRGWESAWNTSNRFNCGHPQMQHQCVQPGGCKSIFQVTHVTLEGLSPQMEALYPLGPSLPPLPATEATASYCCVSSLQCALNIKTNEQRPFFSLSFHPPQILLKNTCTYKVNTRQKLRAVRNAFWMGVSVGMSTEPWIRGMGEDSFGDSNS